MFGLGEGTPLPLRILSSCSVGFRDNAMGSTAERYNSEQGVVFVLG